MKRNTALTDEEIRIKFSRSSVKKLLSYIRPYYGKILFVVILMLLTSFISLLSPYFISLSIDKYIPRKNLSAVLIICLILAFGELIIMFLTRIRAKILNTIGQETVKKMRYDAFVHLQHLPFSYFDSRPHGKIIVRIVNYMNAISNLLSNGIVDIITNIFTLAVIVVFMFKLDVFFTLICLAGIPAFIFITSLLRAAHKKAWRTLSAKISNLNAYIHERISGVKVTQAFTREEEDFRRFSDICKENVTFWMKAKHIEMCIPVSVNIISVIVTVVLYYFGAKGILGKTVELGVLLAFSAYVNRFWAPISTLANYYNQIITCSAYIERIFELLDEPAVIEDKKNACQLPRINGDVEFKNVSFRYDDKKMILKNISFHAEPGMSIAFVGPTGAGKSTVVNLISRFYDICGGEITIDGHKIGDVTIKSLRSQMGIMLQDSFLFSGTIMENIKYSKPEATDSEVFAVSEKVCAHNMILSLENGYETRVSPGGDSLSQGQRQLICFARTMLSDPKILVLDEATSNIDTQTEILLQKGLNEMLKGRTSFIIAHRLSTIKSCDIIMYIEDGIIAECGTHEKLLLKKGKYFELYNSQYKFLKDI